MSPNDEKAVLVIPDFQTLMLPVLRTAAEGEVRISQVMEQLADQFRLSPEERSHLLPSGKQTTFSNRVHWAKSFLGKAGLVALTRRAYFQITDRGKEVLAAPPERIDIKYLNQFPGFQRFRERQAQAEQEDLVSPPAADATTSLTPDEVIRRAHRQLDDALADELLQRIRSGTSAFFESLVVRLLVAMGYGGGSVVDVDKALVGGTGDGALMASLTRTYWASIVSTCRRNDMPLEIR